MKCHELAEQLSQDRPELSPVEIARLCLILLNSATNTEQLLDRDHRLSAWQSASFRLEATSDQHAAIAAELDNLFGDEPIMFQPDQLWTLLRAVKIQSQMLELYIDQVALA
jgi:hypothetical protein